MDELTIAGKLYISARRAAKEYKYHSDYLGQLIRTGKLDGQKVGRSWYIAEDSLNAFLRDSTKDEKRITMVRTSIAPKSTPTLIKTTHHLSNISGKPSTPASGSGEYLTLTYARNKKVASVDETAEGFSIPGRKVPINISSTPMLGARVSEDRAQNTEYSGSEPRLRVGRLLSLSLFIILPILVFILTLILSLEINIGLPI